MSYPPSVAIAALSGSILLSTNRNRNLHCRYNYNVFLQPYQKTSCEETSSTLPSSSSTSSSSSSFLSKERESGLENRLSKITTETKVCLDMTYRFLDLISKTVYVLGKYKYFYMTNDEEEQANARNNNYEISPSLSLSYQEKLSEVHKSSARLFYDTCVSHGGLLIKLGQFISNLHGLIPIEYIQELEGLQDSCPQVPIQTIQKILEQEELSDKIELIETTEEEKGGKKQETQQHQSSSLLGSASLAQVHKARLLVNDGKTMVVAIKVQKPSLKERIEVDFLVLNFLSRSLDYVFPGAGFDWVLPEFHQSIAAELDFRQEAYNMMRCRKLLYGKDDDRGTSNRSISAANIATTKGERKRLSSMIHNLVSYLLFIPRKIFNRDNKTPKVILPYPIMDLTTSNVLVMSYQEGFKITDKEKLKEHGISSKEVASTICALFAELMFVHGFAYGDPHPGNLLVCPRGKQKSSSNNEFDVVLLDHGMYRRFEDDFRMAFCQLWTGFITNDEEKSKEAVRQLLRMESNSDKTENMISKYHDILSMMLVYRLPSFLTQPTQKLGSSAAIIPLVLDKSKTGNQKKEKISEVERRRMKIRELMEIQYGEDIFTPPFYMKFMKSLPRDFVFCMRCKNLTRGLNKALCGSNLDRFKAYGSAASRGGRLVLSPVEKNLLLKKKNTQIIHSLSSKKTEYSDKNELVLQEATSMLNRPVASEIIRDRIQVDLADGQKLGSFRPFFKFWDRLKISWHVWKQTIWLDFLPLSQYEEMNIAHDSRK